MSKILDDIFDSVVTTAAAMSIAGGYNYNWGTINNRDPDSRTYPAGTIEIEDELPFVGNHVLNKYTNDSTFIFKAIAENPADVGLVAGKLIDDFKKLIPTNFETYRALGLVEYEYMESKINWRLPVAYPFEVEIRFRMKYRQERTTPSIT